MVHLHVVDSAYRFSLDTFTQYYEYINLVYVRAYGFILRKTAANQVKNSYSFFGQTDKQTDRF